MWTKDRLDVIQVHQNPISLINFLHASKKGYTLSSLNSIFYLKANFHHLINPATQWGDRHFIDLSLNTAARASGKKMQKKEISITLEWQDGLIYVAIMKKSLLNLQYSSALKQHQLIFFHTLIFFHLNVDSLYTHVYYASSLSL